MTKAAKANPPANRMAPTHPGEMLRDIVIPGLGIGKSHFARTLGISRSTLYAVMAGDQPVTPNIALRLGKAVGNGARFWLGMQTAYDLALEEKRLAAEIERIPLLAAA